MIVYLALGDCGDFYCDSEHPLGIYSTEELAQKRVDTYQKAVENAIIHTGGVAPLEIDVPNPDFPQGL